MVGLYGSFAQDKQLFFYNFSPLNASLRPDPKLGIYPFDLDNHRLIIRGYSLGPI